MKVLIVGAAGMLGHTLFEMLTEDSRFETFGTVRSFGHSSPASRHSTSERLFDNVDARAYETLERVFEVVKPEIVINCIGIVKQLKDATDPILSITINSLLPHKLASSCENIGARLIHISTDCVFDGRKGQYVETDPCSAMDLYGRSKLLGEVGYGRALTLRTSIVGHELHGAHALIDWFLSQSGSVDGYKNAIYTGFPTTELCRVITEFIIPDPTLRGLYHLSSEPISKFELLKIVSKVYNKQITINPQSEFKCDRSLNSDRFREITGFRPRSWEHMIEDLHNYYKKYIPVP